MYALNTNKTKNLYPIFAYTVSLLFFLAKQNAKTNILYYNYWFVLCTLSKSTATLKLYYHVLVITLDY